MKKTYKELWLSHMNVKDRWREQVRAYIKWGGVIIKMFAWLFAMLFVCIVFSSKRLLVYDHIQSQPTALTLIELAVTGQNTCSPLCPSPYDSKPLEEYNNNKHGINHMASNLRALIGSKIKLLFLVSFSVTF